MYLAYSALNQLNQDNKTVKLKPVSKKTMLRFRGYVAACNKYQQEIAAIKQYLPDWQPAFKY